jgi:Spy/CpxP family protein refolding chaperone
MSPMSGWTAMKTRYMAVSPRRRALLALLMVFAAGLAGGALLEDIVDDFDRPFATAGDDDDDDGTHDSEETLLANLDLTPDQRAGIERLFQSREDRLERYWETQLPDLETVVDSSREDIRAILTPAQRAVYDSGLTRLRVHSQQEWKEKDDD